jgi:hypothetical protein
VRSGVERNRGFVDDSPSAEIMPEIYGFNLNMNSDDYAFQEFFSPDPEAKN